MKLRHRFALTFAVASLGMLVASRVVTIASFTRLQQYELDRGLRARAREEGSHVALLGRQALEREYAAKEEESDPLEQLVTYGALYRADGTLVADTPSFSHAPTLGELGLTPPRATGECFDFVFRGKRLRGVLVEVSPPAAAERQYLLLAASRRDMDDDARQLLAVGWWVVLACLPVALTLGWWLGRRMTHGLEALAGAAGRVTAGELEMAPPPSAARDDEVAALAGALREMVGRLKRLIETERRFASHAAHELRSPLAALRTELELALRRQRTVPEYEATLREALEDTNRLVDLAEDLLVVARLESGATDDRDEDVELGALVREAIPARGAPHVSISGDATAITVRGGRVGLARMIRNLVDNAITHGGADVRVHVGLRAETREATVSVEDDGPGVPPEDVDRIFEPFHRSSRARREPGAGLGLGIAREIAKRHGGDIKMESPAHPTRFVVTLPTVERS